MARRREERVALAVPVRVWGTDKNGKPFMQMAETVDITRLGARIKGLTEVTSPGDIIGIQRDKEKARFRVIWVGKPGTPQAEMIGIHSVEPTRFIWGIPIPQQWSPKVAHPCVPQDEGVGRRIQPRYACEGSAEILREGRTALWATVADISLSGSYVESLTPLPPKTEVEVVLNIEGVELRSKAVVRASHAGVGMGLAFSEMSIANRSKLDEMISGFAAAQAPPVVEAKKPTGPAAQDVIALARRLDDASNELKELQAALQAGPTGLDPRVLENFREAANHVRQIAWIVQQWLQRSSLHQDPFAILGQIQAERVRVTAELANQLAMDLDASEVDSSTPGLPALHENIKRVRKRLAILFRETDRDSEDTAPAETAD